MPKLGHIYHVVIPMGKAVNKDIGLLINFSDFKLDPRRVERKIR